MKKLRGSKHHYHKESVWHFEYDDNTNLITKIEFERTPKNNQSSNGREKIKDRVADNLCPTNNGPNSIFMTFEFKNKAGHKDPHFAQFTFSNLGKRGVMPAFKYDISDVVPGPAGINGHGKGNGTGQ